MHVRRERFGFGAQGSGERHVLAAPRCAVEKPACRACHLEHLFETEGLGAQLNLVATASLGPSPFVLDGPRLPEALFSPQGDAGRRGAKLNHVGLASQPEAEGVQTEAAGDSEARPAFRPGVVRLLMQFAAFGGEAVLRPHLLDMNQGPLALAEHEVLEAGEGQEVVFGVPHTNNPVSRP